MLKSTSKILSSSIFAAAVLLTFAGAIAWQLSTYTVSDDWHYRCIVPPTESLDFWRSTSPDISSAADIPESVANHYMLVNGRLTHIIFIPLQLLPRWVSSLIAGLAIGFMFLGLLRLGAGKKQWKRPRIVASATLLLWCGFPWYDTMQSAVYQFNYSVVTVFWLGYIAGLHRIEHFRNPAFAAFGACSFLTGWLHEGFTCGMTAFTFAAFLLSYGRARKRYLILTGTLLLSLLASLCSGTTLRMTDHLSYYSCLGFYIPYTKLINQLWPLWLAIVLGMIVLRKRKSGRKQLLPWLAPYASALAVIIVQTILLHSYERGLWPAEMLSSLLVLRFLAHLLPDQRPGRAETGIAMLLLVIYGGWLWQLVRYQRITSAELRHLDSIMLPRGDKDSDVYFADLSCEWEQPPYLMDMCSNRIRSNADDNYHQYSYHTRGRAMYSAILPDSFRGRSFEQLPRIPGRNDLRGVWPVMIGKGRPHRNLRVHFGAHRPTVKPTDRLLAAIKAGSFRSDSTEQEMAPGCYPIRYSQGDTATYYLYFPRFDVRTNARRYFLSADTLSPTSK